MPNLVGTGLNQVPTNGMLGGLAYQSPDHASIKDLDLKNLSQINSEIANTAVDIFIYDTRKDSDGGAWRKRTQNTSWYNETLNTATRGSRKDFPAVAVIVATADDVFIYDGDDPDLPLWMKFIGSGSARAVRQGMSSITMLNGLMTTGRSGSERAVGFVNFISDYVYQIANNGKYEFGTGGIINRNTDGSFINVSSSTQIVNNTVNDVAMTVLPSAPIDPATGLPVPTIAVATNGGVSVIKDDRSVVDGFTSITSIVGIIQFSGNKVIYAADNGSEYKWIYQFDIPSSDNTGNSYLIDPNSIITNYNHNADFSSYSAIPLDSTGSGNYTNDFKVSPDNNIFVGVGRKLAIVDFEDGTYNSRTALTSLITSTYNTGYLPWNIKGAFLSDTSTASVTGTELVTNGTFAGNLNGWTLAGEVTPTYDSGSGGAKITTAVGVDGNISQTISSTAGVVVTFSITARTSGYVGLVLNGTLVLDGLTALQSYTYYSDSTITSIALVHRGGGGGYAIVDNVSVRRTEKDRSVNNKGLAVYGTITKSAVAGSGATAAELVAYSGFNTTTNYLQQPYNSALTFGTNNFSVMLWYYNNTSTEIRVQRNTGGADGWALTLGNAGGDFYIHNGNFSTFAGFTGISNTNVWNHWTITRIYNDKWYVYKNGVLAGATTTLASTNFNDLGTFLINAPSGNSANSISLVRISQSVPSPDQIAKIYNDEKVLFQENAKCTLYGSSDAVTALAYDDTTNLLSVGTSSGRSDFQGLRRINNTTTAVTTAISASNGLIAEQ